MTYRNLFQGLASQILPTLTSIIFLWVDTSAAPSLVCLTDLCCHFISGIGDITVLTFYLFIFIFRLHVNDKRKQEKYRHERKNLLIL